MNDSKAIAPTSQTSLTPPSKTTADHFLSLVRGAISAVPIFGGASAELFAAVVGGPYQRRMDDWMKEVSRTLAQVADSDPKRFRDIFNDDEFLDLLVSATRAAVSTHREEKRRWLASAVERSANGEPIEFDTKLAFVRFVEEMTPSHVALLLLLVRDVERVAGLKSFSDLHSWSGLRCSQEQFKLFCNDLANRVLARFSEALDDFPGMASMSAIVTEDSGEGIMVAASDLGREFLHFIGETKKDNNHGVG